MNIEHIIFKYNIFEYDYYYNNYNKDKDFL